MYKSISMLIYMTSLAMKYFKGCSYVHNL